MAATLDNRLRVPLAEALVDVAPGWADLVAARPAVQRGRKVNRVHGDPASQLHERHDASDFETKTQDKLGG